MLLLHDFRFALRSLRRSPGFALGVIGVLALGIGASAAMFTVLRATLLRPLLYKDASRLVTLEALDPKGEPSSNTFPDLSEWRQRSHTLQGLAFYREGGSFLSSSAGDQFVDTPAISAELFSVLGVAPRLGRCFTQQEQDEAAQVVLISDAVWHGLFRADPGVLGRSLKLDGKPYNIIGVMPAQFSFPANAKVPQVWIPVAVPIAERSRNMQTAGFSVIARQKSEVNSATVGEELTALQQGLKPLYTGGMAEALGPSRVRAMSYRASLDNKARPIILTISAAVFVLWSIACASAAALFLARGTARRSEIALRSALGAGRWQVVRHLLVESLLLGCSSFACGMALSHALLAMSNRVLLRQLGHPVPTGFSPFVVLTLLLATLVSTLFFGGLPALLAMRASVGSGLRGGNGHASAGHLQQRMQRMLVVGELALTLTLLISCGLLLRTVFSLRKIPLGFRTDHILVAELNVPTYRYAAKNQLHALYEALLQKTQQLPGVQSASLSTVMPLSNDFDMTYGMFNPQDKAKPAVSFIKLRMATPELHEILGFRMVQGRYFNADDTAASMPVAVVNRAYRDRYDPDGKRFAAGNFSFGPVHIVGVMDDLRQINVQDTAVPELDLAAAQLTPDTSVPFTGVYQTLMQAHVELALRTRLAPAAVSTDLRRVLQGADPALASSSIRTMDQIVDDSLGAQLIAERLLLAFAGLALLVALTGLYSLLAYTVTLRTRELGVRLALGAQRGDILRLVLRGAAGLLALGIGLGLLLSLAGAHLLSRFLYGVIAYDPRTFAAAACALLLVGFAAAFIPAQRAAATEPTEALRAE